MYFHRIRKFKYEIGETTFTFFPLYCIENNLVINFEPLIISKNKLIYTNHHNVDHELEIIIFIHLKREVNEK